LPPGVSKGAALSAWLDTCPESPDIIVAAGDHHNDLELLAAAHIAVAPEDAAADVLRAAKIIMPSADRDGFAVMAEWLLKWEGTRDEITGSVVL